MVIAAGCGWGDNVSPRDMAEQLLIDRNGLVSAITAFLAGNDARTLAGLRQALEREIDVAGPSALADLGDRLAHTGSMWSFFPRDPLARRIHHLLADRLLEPTSTLSGVEYLAALDDEPVVMLANHLSYSDANLLEVLLYRSGAVALADRLTVVAGPKVYSSLRRRFSSLCFGTIKTAQSSTLSSDDNGKNVRDVARAARLAIEIAHERLTQGDAVLIFAEGTRSRTSGLQPMLPAVSRYLDYPGAWVLPVGIAGTEALFPIGDHEIHPVRIVVRIGRPVRATVLEELTAGNRRLMMDVVGVAIASLLPEEYRGAYGDGVDGLDEARVIARDLSSAGL
jgi:1-acyl-sn-glycerol-3-phosphate acyltransferase